MDVSAAWVTALAGRALVAGTPLLLGTLGETLTERAGILNLGIEGLMAVGAVTGFGVAFSTGNPWLGASAAVGIGMLLGLLHAVVTVTLRANQVVAGLALTMFGLGLSSLLGKPYVGKPLPQPIGEWHLPILSDLPILGESLFTRDPLFYLGIGLSLLLWFVLFRTRWGVIVRACGESPLAAATSGVDVQWVRYVCLMSGSGLCGLAGAYLSLVYNPSWVEGMTAGRGWIVVALTIFAFWNPLRAIFGAYAFGGIYVVQYSLQSWNVSPNLLMTLPYVLTLVALVLISSKASRHLAAPASLSKPFFPGEKN
ncbi:MAG TPA: ABC transporter permease [Candidatus Ozemobacteraceae bacterium]|nr:ABC transporter permease [Candidatus Ozemobacteraceae bacterium]